MEGTEKVIKMQKTLHKGEKNDILPRRNGKRRHGGRKKCCR